MSLDPIRIYDYLERSRRRILDAARPLTPDQWAREFEIGPKSLQNTLTHLVIAEWYYVKRMNREDVPPCEAWELRDETPLFGESLEAAWAKQAQTTKAAIADVRNWDETFDYRVTDDDGQRLIVTASAADLITQLALHEAHHRAQALNIMRQLGVTVPGGDFDFNATMMPRRVATN